MSGGRHSNLTHETFRVLRSKGNEFRKQNVNVIEIWTCYRSDDRTSFRSEKRKVFIEYLDLNFSTGVLLFFLFSVVPPSTVGRDSVVGIVTRYGLGRPEIESRWWRDIPHPSKPAVGPSWLPIQWVLGLSRG